VAASVAGGDPTKDRVTPSPVVQFDLFSVDGIVNLFPAIPKIGFQTDRCVGAVENMVLKNSAHKIADFFAGSGGFSDGFKADANGI
jgi:hypothetical protein